MAAGRLGAKLDRIEQLGPEFHRRVADGFREMASDDPERWVVIDGSRSIDEVEADGPRGGAGAATTPGVIDPWASIVGQDRAVAELRAAAEAPVHAYLLVGPRGSGKRALAAAFAAELLSHGSEGEDADRHRQLALAEQHPDLVVFEREGAAISSAQTDAVIKRASLAPIEGDRKVLVLDEFHLDPARQPGQAAEGHRGAAGGHVLRRSWSSTSRPSW